MVRKIDAGAQRTAETAEKTSKDNRQRRNDERRSGKSPDNFSCGNERQKSHERITSEKPPAVYRICPWKSDAEKKQDAEKREKQRLPIGPYLFDMLLLTSAVK